MPLEALAEWVRCMVPPLMCTEPSLLMHLPSCDEDTTVMSALPLTMTSVSEEMPCEPVPEICTSTVPPLMLMLSAPLMPLQSSPLMLIWSVPPVMENAPVTLMLLWLSVVVLMVRLPLAMVTVPVKSRPSEPGATMLIVPLFQTRLLLPWMPSLSVLGMLMVPELTVMTPSTRMPCLALPVTCRVPLPLTVRAPAA